MSETVTWEQQVEVEAEVEVCCGECGDELNISSSDGSLGKIEVSVDPCEACKERVEITSEVDRIEAYLKEITGKVEAARGLLVEIGRKLEA